jgi:hypothetical protein
VRLATLLLTAALAAPAGAQGLAAGAAQGSSSLPWKAAPTLPWQLVEAGAPAPPYTAMPTQSLLDLTVRLDADGALRVTDSKGLIRLRAGLPGRPLRAWRDWGVPVPDLAAPLQFPGRSPLQMGIGRMPVGTPDLRGGLEGLLWVLDDDEAYLSVVHPATAQVVHLPMPGGQNLTLTFHPDHLEVREHPPGGPPAAMAWTLHWVALLPQFIQLSLDANAGKPRGTALAPFPKEN